MHDDRSLKKRRRFEKKMDQKSWLWKKKSSEKTVDKVNLPFRGNEEEMVTLLSEKAELENDLKSFKEKLSSALSDSNAKDDVIKKHAKTAQEAMEERDKMEAKMVSLKKELDYLLQERGIGEERTANLEAALKECMQQLRFVRDEQAERIQDAVLKASNEFEKSRMMLEAKLEESCKRIVKLGVDNNNLSEALLGKEKIIEDLSKQKAQLEVDISALTIRLESTEKDNASLKYEVRLVEKELEIRNEEREFNRRTSEASHRQHLESVKKIAKLESECQRLRVLVRKRLPGPAALAKMKSEVEVLGRESNEMRRRRPNYSHIGSLHDDGFSDNAVKKIDLLTEQLFAIEEENKNLKEVLNKKTNELQFSRSMYARTASKLSQVESHLDEVSKSSTALDASRNGLDSHDLSLASMSDIGSDDKASCAESWASALISELEHFKNGKQRGSPSSKTVGASDLSLMDDFVEMEKLAIVSVDNQSRSPVLSSDANATDACSLEAKGREIVPVLDACSNSDIKSKNRFEEAPYWLQDILKVVLQKSQSTHRNPHEILEDVRFALATISVENDQMKESSDNSGVAGLITWNSSDVVTASDVFLTDKNHQQLQEDLSKSIHKIIELLEGIPFPNPDDGASETLSKRSFFPYKETTSGYMVRLFQWKSSELSGVLQKFVHTCYDLLNGKTDVKRFTQELTFALEWILNHCFSLQDVSSMRESVRKHFDWDDAHSEGEAEGGIIGRFSDVDKLSYTQEKSCLSTVATSNRHHICSEIDKFYSTVDENKKLKDELVNVESAKKILEEQLISATDKIKSLMNQLQESEKTIMILRTELENFKQSEALNYNQKLAKEDHDKQFNITKAELNEALHKLSTLEVELGNKNNSCEELEAACLELQLQLESVSKKTTFKDEWCREEKQLRTDWEITAATEKLAECQETIMNLGKQLKALASPTEAAMFDKVIPADTDTVTSSAELTAPNNKIAPTASTELIASNSKIEHQRSSLLDRMIAEDNAKYPNVKETEQPSSAFVSSGVIQPLEKILILKNQDDEKTINSLAIVPSKKAGGGSLWKKLLWRKKKSRSKIPPMPFAP